MRVKIPTVKFHPSWKVTNWKPGCWSARNLGQVRFTRLSKLLESPIEKLFWTHGYNHLSMIGQFSPQMKIGEYRVDFVLTNIPRVPSLKIIIELDGFDYHRSPSQFSRDAKRARDLQRAGWKIIRFTGAEINGDVPGCVRETVELVKDWSRGLR